jgi:hypothetical protein
MFKIKITKKQRKKGRKSLYNPKQKAALPSFLEKLEISRYFRTRFIYTLWFYIHTSHAHASVLERENDAKRLDIITLDQEFDLLRGLV